MNPKPPSPFGDFLQDGDRQDPVEGHGHPASQANPYATQFERPATPPAPDLDAAAPELRSSDMQRMNRRALGFVAALVLLLGLAAIWMVGNLTRSDTAQKPKEEVVTIPAAPQLPPPLPRAPTPPPVAPIALAPSALPPLPPGPQAPAGPQKPTLLERRIASSSSTVAVSEAEATQAAQSPSTGMAPGMGMGMPGGTDPGMAPNNAYRAKPLSPVSNAQPLSHANVLMLRGTYIRCVLETHIVSDIPGFTSCVVTEPVYAVNGRRLLLPKGSKVLGRYDTEPNGPRIAVVWDRIVTPTGIDVSMASPGVDNLGGAGHPGYLDEHWGQRISSALMVSLFADAFKYAAAQNGPGTTTVSNGGLAVQSPYESYTAQTLQNLAGQAVRRGANRPDTVTINQGTVVNVYVAKDVDFSAVIAGS
ncbi:MULTISPECIES: TrbI/VirB10 family protein [unclassified Variovorax]|uniref:TrbI/VirB10 family protein n=1 Tax=unclassified Variovorax TaxID=663243 RepID=UPI002577F37B|nr:MULTISPECIES: TrbI/VirB10 family protein [unclassified Variovorax]MDM0090480.1 TrbI/VirB10 family protein [Variovorax sp. J22G40]MDM0147855.1 TrbI/VirB10 family protein [Variovorax sp. J2P1-31]